MKLFICVYLFSGLVFASNTDFLGKRWKDLPKTAYPPFSLPVPKFGNGTFEIRMYQKISEKYIVTLTEGDHAKDLDLVRAALDLTEISKTGETPESNCFPKGKKPEDQKILIGLVRSERDKTQLQPRKVWSITSKDSKFEEIPAAGIICEPINYAGEY